MREEGTRPATRDGGSSPRVGGPANPTWLWAVVRQPPMPALRTPKGDHIHLTFGESGISERGTRVCIDYELGPIEWAHLGRYPRCMRPQDVVRGITCPRLYPSFVRAVEDTDGYLVNYIVPFTHVFKDARRR